MILVNFNSDSKYHSFYALCSVDNHGRCGFYTILEQTSINDLINEINDIMSKKHSKSTEFVHSWDNFNQLPIKKK